jgi:signal transduction histidine kinase
VPAWLLTGSAFDVQDGWGSAETVKFVAGVLLLPLAAYPITAWACARAALAHSFLGIRDPDTDRRLVEVTRSRARLVDAFETERRRIERDLHDGTQQRLVAMTMALGLARLDLPAGSNAATQIDTAREHARQALVELRELIRGVHPQVLTDRGLAAAITEAASRSSTPVDVDVDLQHRPPAPVEIAAYFAVSEALTNINKHSRACRAWIHGRLTTGQLVLEIHDDGIGGADPVAGTGLTGIADRVTVVDGRLLLSSPPGGPTVLRMEIPCPPTVH